VNSRSHARGNSLARLVELTQPLPTWRVLDVATGAGHTALAMAPHVAQVVASDLTPEMLDVARGLAKQRGVSNISFADAEAEDLPFKDQSFDLVTCRIAPHHFADVPRFVSEVARVLRRDGVFGLVDNISPDDAGAADTYNAFEKLRDPSHGRCLAVQEWLALLEQAGLAIRHCELLDKEMEFDPWTEQQKVAAPIKQKLRAMLLESSGELKSFLRPREHGDTLEFTLTEAVIVAERPA
jgi:ubiquinone/menaquinone biosynthesis C-methylase UbiE